MMNGNPETGAALLYGLHDIHYKNPHFGRTEVLKGISLTVREGEVLGLIGASGSGKSTLLRCVNRLETPTTGTVHFRGAEVTMANLNQVRREIGMVFQRFNLFPHLTALENVTGQGVRRARCWAFRQTGPSGKGARCWSACIWARRRIITPASFFRLGSSSGRYRAKADNYPGALRAGAPEGAAVR